MSDQKQPKKGKMKMADLAHATAESDIPRSGHPGAEMALTHHERDQLASISGTIYGDGRPYLWGRKTMPKLAAKGLVERHPDRPKAWRATPKGLEIGRKLFREMWPQ